MNYQYDDEDEDQVKQITIPNHKILFYDSDLHKKEEESERSTVEKVEAKPQGVSDNQKKISEKILECNSFFKFV